MGLEFSNKPPKTRIHVVADDDDGSVDIVFCGRYEEPSSMTIKEDDVAPFLACFNTAVEKARSKKEKAKAYKEDED